MAWTRLMRGVRVRRKRLVEECVHDETGDDGEKFRVGVRTGRDRSVVGHARLRPGPGKDYANDFG